MPVDLSLARRNALIAAFRRRVYEKNGVTWFPHQADWQLASEGLQLLPLAYTGPVNAQRIWQYTDVLSPDTELLDGENIVRHLTVNDVPCSIVRRTVVPRPAALAR